MKVSEPTGRLANRPGDLAETGESGRVQQKARRRADRHADDGEKHDRRKPQAHRQRLVAATTTSKVANTARTRTISSMAPYSDAAGAP